jgi:lipopolysaccharide export system permease protein
MIGALYLKSPTRYPVPLAAFTDTDDTVTYKPADLYLTDLFNPTAQRIADSGSRGELLAEAHSRLSSPLYAFVAMAMALAAILGGSFSRTGYGGRIARAAAFFLLVRIVGYGLVPASAWNGWLNVFQYVLPVVATVISLRVLFRALKPHRQTHGPLARLKARLA